MVSPEAQARQQIDRLLEHAGCHSFIEGKAAGVIEAKKQGATLSGVETQSDCASCTSKANLLFFDKKPASETPCTKTLWIYDRRSRHPASRDTSASVHVIAAEIVEDLEAALVAFREIAGDLAGAGAQNA